MKRLIRASLDSSNDKLILYKGSSEDLSTIDLNLYKDYKEVGMHCGTLEQAKNVNLYGKPRYLHKLVVSNGKFLEFNRDESSWKPRVVATVIGQLTGDNELCKSVDKANTIAEKNEVIQNWFKFHNLSGFSYPNSGEGEGLSYCICDLGIIQSIELISIMNTKP